MKCKVYFCILNLLILSCLTACGGNQQSSGSTLSDTSILIQNPQAPVSSKDTDADSSEPEQNYLTPDMSFPQQAIENSTPSLPMENGPIALVPQYPTEESNTPVQSIEAKSNTLIAYFTWAENTVVADLSAIDVDATTSASVLVPGHVAQMAKWIQEETSGDLFSIVTSEPYSSDYNECLDRAADEKADNARPTLAGSVGNMADYDVIFLGYPDWWGTCPMAVLTFLDSYDLSGKTVIPFCAHGTSGLASSVRDIKLALPGVTVLDAVGVQRPGMDTALGTAEKTVKDWLAKLEY